MSSEGAGWDRFREITERMNRYAERLHAVEEDNGELRTRLARIEDRLARVDTNAQECNQGVREVKQAITDRDLRAAGEYRRTAEENKANRRWIITAIFTAMTVIIGAVGLLVVILQKAPT